MRSATAVNGPLKWHLHPLYGTIPLGFLADKPAKNSETAVAGAPTCNIFHMQIDCRSNAFSLTDQNHQGVDNALAFENIPLLCV